MANNSNSELRSRGFLTEDDRQFLLGDKEEPPEGSARRQKRHKIRKRLENAILDFQVIEQGLPDKDIEQIFDPAYEWGRDRRRLNEEGRYDEYPETNEFIQSLLAFFNFFAYSMAKSRITEVANLRDLIVQEGFERGLRRYHLSTGGDYINYNVDIEVTVAERESMQNHIVNIERNIPEKSDEAAEKILDLYHQNRIPAGFAQQLWDHYVDQELE
ncbi:hypothetical protein [Halobellus clavatus]|uniref:Domain of unknown function domain-containing protein n=1 Tax=Halobellus clavatus TaxID=660517 RepID=A0A1H3GAC0_9EURY|nr:hypothetical protein [Halobellus clavatus]SDX99444.1 hypothetical protein SAMN04487946_10531 [Halobellus clavatus]